MKRTVISLVIAVGMVGADAMGSVALARQRNSGLSDECGRLYSILDPQLLLLIAANPPLGAYIATRPDEGWAWVDPTQKLRRATGVVKGSRVAKNDTPANHDSHDFDFELILDDGQEDLLSIQDNAIGVEWETGVHPSELNGDGSAPTFAKWAWPSEGDRVWVEGHWIHDCGHPEGDLYRTEIHPPRAIASMRDHAAPIPGTGTTPVPVTLADVQISGKGGYVVNQLNCGVDIILGPYGDTCGQPTPPDRLFNATAIDEDFTFDVCLPPRDPAALAAAFASRADIGPYNTVSVEPVVVRVAAEGACKIDPRYDQEFMARVTVPLAGTATPPSAMYTRRIYMGWVSAPSEVLPQRRLTLRSMDLHEDHDLDPGDGELTFWWLNVDRAGWLRLSDFAGGMDDYDDDFSVGDGEKTFTGASMDFYLRHGQAFTVRSRGYEQDCFDNSGAVGVHQFFVSLYVACYLAVTDAGAGDAVTDATRVFSSDDLGDRTMSGGSEYDLRLSVEALPITFEDTSFLSARVRCEPSGEVALVGEAVPCIGRLDNAGPALPRRTEARITVDGTATSLNPGTWTIQGSFAVAPQACTLLGAELLCEPFVVPVVAAKPVEIATAVTLGTPGTVTVRLATLTASTDPIPTDNTASTTIDAFLSVGLDVAPRDDSNTINLKRGGTVSIAVLSSPEFDATTIAVGSTCFGDAEAPGERACTERHSSIHSDDVDRDGDVDVLLHYALSDTGIDEGDTRACVKGVTTAGVGFYACQAIVTQ